ncbi:MAG: hypothetical protein IH796_01975 [Deltaproteobacteria bacterium]|nr:hypothetical protein [Deltaproteobacteria bacterium]
METWRLATIDVGTNTVLLLIVEIDHRGDFRILEDRAEITRLGEGVQQNGVLGQGGQQRTLDVLRGYYERCQDLDVQEIKIAGTSALREAANASDDDAKALAKWATNGRSFHRIRATVQMAERFSKIHVKIGELDLGGYLINVENGTLDLRTGKLRDHHRSDRGCRQGRVGARARTHPPRDCVNGIEWDCR